MVTQTKDWTESVVFSRELADFSDEEITRAENELRTEIQKQHILLEGYRFVKVNAWDSSNNATYKRLDAYPEKHHIARQAEMAAYPAVVG